MPFFEQHAWTWVTRTYLFDQFITEQVEEGVDLVLNLAAGLDARPYRMALPPSLRWVEVDLPELLTYKEEVLAGEKPVCQSSGFRWTFPTRAHAASCSTGWVKPRTRHSSSPRA